MAIQRDERARGSRGRNPEQGSAMVEFAMVFLLLFGVVTLIAEGGLFFSTWLAATNGAREGARYAAPCLKRPPTVGQCSVTDVENLVNDRTRGFLDQSSGYSVVVDASSNRTVTVTVTATMASVAPILGNLPVYGKSTMRLETSPPN